jgi:hypothetical protein
METKDAPILSCVTAIVLQGPHCQNINSVARALHSVEENYHHRHKLKLCQYPPFLSVGISYFVSEDLLEFILSKCSFRGRRLLVWISQRSTAASRCSLLSCEICPPASKSELSTSTRWRAWVHSMVRAWSKAKGDCLEP